MVAANDGPPDALQIAYVEAWLAARPEQTALRLALARQLLRVGDVPRAQLHLQRLLAEGDAQTQRHARALLLEAQWQRLQGLPPADAAAQREMLRAQLRLALAEPIDPVQGVRLAERALVLDEAEAARAYWQRLLDEAPRLPAAVWEVAGRQALSAGAHLLAARLLLQAREAERRLPERRRLFLSAMRAAQAGNALAEALELAERHLGELVADTETLEFLTRLALAAGRPDIAQRYAVWLLRLSLAPAAEHVPVLALPRRLPAAAHAQERTARLPYDERLYLLALEVFLANGNLEDALVVARSAVRQRPEDLRWRLHLAQLADWTNRPQLALEQWEAIARRRGLVTDWEQVARRAQQLNDRRLRLQALEALRQLQPQAQPVQRAWLEALEEAGEPVRALQALRAALGETGADPWRGERLKWLARLARELGERDLVRRALQALQQDFAVTVERALMLARLEEEAGDLAAARAALAAAQGLAERDIAANRAFWDAWAELAVATGDRAQALAAWERLYAAGVADDSDLAALADALEHIDPPRAARIAVERFRRSGQSRAAVRAFDLLLRANDPNATRAWLDSLTSTQREQLQRDADFLSLRAQWWLAQGARRAAARDAWAAATVAPSVEREATALWLLILAGEAETLRSQLLALGARALDEPLLAQAAAAGWLSLAQPARALPYLARVARADLDPLWRLEYADALERLGASDLAADERLRLWRQRHELLQNADAQTRAQRLARLLPLAALLADGDAAAAWRREILARQKEAAELPEAVIGYWLARGAPEVAHAWLLARRLSGVDGPAWTRLAVAAAHDDGAWLAVLLDEPAVTRQSPLALAEAAWRTGARALAQTLAFEAVQQAPFADEAQQRLRQLMLGTTEAAAASALAVEHELLRQSPLRYTLTTLQAGVRVSPRARLTVQWEWTEADSLLADSLAAAPPAEVAALGFAWSQSRDDEILLRLGRRAGASGAFALLRWQGRPAPRLTAAVQVGSGQTVTDNAYLRLGAQSTRFAIDGTAAVALRDAIFLQLQFDQYRSLQQEPVGRGRQLRLALQHSVALAYPDASVRLVWTQARYRPHAGVAKGMLPLLPSSLQPLATNAAFLPADTDRIGLELGFGESARAAWTHAWRPFATLSLSRETGGRSDYALRLGAAGHVLGADALQLEWGYGSARAGVGTRYTEAALRYRWAF